MNQNFEDLADKYGISMKIEKLFDIGQELDDENFIVSYLNRMSYLLSKKYNKKCIILIDEYEAGIQSASENNQKEPGFYEKTLKMFSRLYCRTFKENLNFEKGLLTEVLKISGASLFSGFNKVADYSILDKQFKERMKSKKIE